MGYATEMYGVDLNEIDRMMREHDLSILERIYQKSPYLFQGRLVQDDITVGQAIAYLLSGKAFQIPSNKYGYALKEICRCIGVSLPDDDAVGAIDALELDSPLGEDKSPVELPPLGDFPFISHLTSEEVKIEADRLKGIDLNYPDDLDLETARKGYANAIREASEKGLGVVTFYH